MDVYKIYTNTGNHVASDTVITKIPIISSFVDSHKMHIVDSFSKYS